MIPRLYSESETNFNNNGICALSETVSATVTEEANSIFTLELEYPIHGMWFSEIKRLRLIKALPNVGDEEHIFRIKEIVKSTDPKMVRIYASTKSEDLNGHIIKDFNRKDTAANLILSSLPSSIYPPTNYLFHTDITTKVSPNWFMRNVTNSILGSEGSLVDLLGGGELKRNNDSLYLYRRRGNNNVTRVTPRKNLRGLEITESTKGLITRIQPYMILQDPETYEDIIVIGDVVSSPLANNYPNQSVVPIDFSGYELENKTQLDQRAASYFTSMNPGCDTPNVTLNVDLINIHDSSEYSKFKDFETVKLFDTVTVYVPRYDVDVLVKIVSVTFDVLREKVIKITAGQPSSSFLQDLNKTYNDKLTNVFETLKGDINTVRMSADGKTKVFTGPNEPDISISSKDDMWFKELGSGEMEMYIFDGAYWQVVINANTSKEILDKIDQAEKDIVATTELARSGVNKAEQAIIDAGFANSAITAANGKITSLEENLNGFQLVVQDTYANKNTVTALATQWTQTTELAHGHTSAINSLGNDLNFRVKSDEIITQINLSPENILISGKRITIDGNTYIANGVIKTAHIADLAVSGAKIANASISSAKIISLDASKITAGTIDTSLVNVIAASGNKRVQIKGEGLSAIDSNGKLRLAIGVQDIAGDGQSDPSNILFYTGNGTRSFSIGTNTNDTLVIGTEASNQFTLIRTPQQITLESNSVRVASPNVSNANFWNFANLSIDGTQHPNLRANIAGTGTIGTAVQYRLRKIFTVEADTQYLSVGVGDTSVAADLNTGGDSSGGRVWSMATYNRTYSGSANMFITNAGTFGRVTSARKYKMDIQVADDAIDNAKKILQINPVSWIDKSAFLNGKSKHRYHGFIADDFHDLGLNEVVIYGEDGQVESLAYDRISMYHNVILKDHEEKLLSLEETVEQLQQEIEQLRTA